MRRELSPEGRDGVGQGAAMAERRARHHLLGESWKGGAGQPEHQGPGKESEKSNPS